MPSVSLKDLQGEYDVTYNSTPATPGWFESGVGKGNIKDSKFTIVDGHGLVWDINLNLTVDGKILFDASIDPTGSPLHVGLMDKNGQVTRERQDYSGEMRFTQSNDKSILSTKVQQGPVTINVQMLKKS